MTDQHWWLMGLSFQAAFLLIIAFYVVLIIGYWKLFEKADYKGWYCLIPFFNLYIIAKIAFGSGITFILFFIPFVNTIYHIFLSVKTARVFNKGFGYALGLIFLWPLFIIFLGFSRSTTYTDPKYVR